jgi:glutamyl-Q tRNA(Asp) synthetase
MEDLDPPREQAGAAEQIAASLLAHGLHWDGPLMHQSQRLPAYAAALARLNSARLLFECDCSRGMLGPQGNCQRGCQCRQAQLKPQRATRIAVPPSVTIEFHDALQGPQVFALGAECPNFTLLRKDGLFAYQLAVVVDDAEQGITQVVRGSDLLDTTPRQIFLQQCLALETPDYLHVPVITDKHGQKLSKQNLAAPLDDDRPTDNLREALHFLRQPEPPATTTEVLEILAFATSNWARASLPALLSLPANELASR